ncbi:dispanin subfamily A member 2b-like [Centroberyx affinis]|uniref:dispanin subfamily A member 2b-like n=1 Tax=Centroberyx affinis TaxID=166261 RepID=UPI003A5BB344
MEPPTYHQSELVPMKESRHEGQPAGPAVVQYTTVRVDHTEPLPRDHIIWSLCCLLYANPLCLGLAAFCFSIKARDRKMAGDLEGARKHGSTALCLNIFTLILVVIMIILFFIYFRSILFYLHLILINL